MIKRPTPPSGFVRFHWKTVKRDGYSAQLCPSCGKSEGFVHRGNKQGFQDKEAASVWRAVRKGRFDKNSYDAFCIMVQGDMLKCHWSRWSMMECMGCGVEIWHDFQDDCGHSESGCTCGGWRYYYKPKGTLTLDAFMRTTTHVNRAAAFIPSTSAPQPQQTEEG